MPFIERFNPRTRVGCDKLGVFDVNPNFVSIHAPVWGATLWAIELAMRRGVSIHAPVWGATIFKIG